MQFLRELKEIQSDLDTQLTKERTLIEQWWRETENVINALMESVPCGFCEFLVAPGFPLLRANQRFYNIHGYTQDQFAHEFQNNMLHLVHPNYKTMFQNELAAAAGAALADWHFHFQILRGDGMSRWIQLNASFRGSAQGKICSCIFRDVTKAQHEWDGLEQVLEKNGIAVFDYDIEQNILTDRHGFSSCYGVPPTMTGLPQPFVDEGYVREDAALLQDMFAQIQAGAQEAGCEVRFYSPKFEGRFAWVKIIIRLLHGDEDIPQKAIGFAEFIDDQKRAEQVASIFERYQKVMMIDSIACYDINLTTNTILDGSSIWEKRMLKIRQQLRRTDSYTELIQACARELVSEDTRDHYLLQLDRASLLENFKKGLNETRFEYKRLGAGNNLMWIYANTHTVLDEDGNVRMLLLYRDVSREKKNVSRLLYQAQRDALTGLYNRSAGQALIEARLATSLGGLHAFYILDIDDFKTVNDTYGHQNGDRLLQEVARVLRSVFRRDDIPIRLGGDEFIVFAFGFATADQAVSKAKRILQNMCQVGKDCAPGFRCSVSIGIAVAQGDSTNYEKMYRVADEALYSVKNGQKNGCKMVVIHDT